MVNWSPSSEDELLDIQEPPGIGTDTLRLNRIPAVARDALFAVARVQQITLRLALCCILGTMSVVASPFRKVRLPFGGESPTALYLFATAEASERKSSSLALTLSGVDEIQREEDERYLFECEKYKIARTHFERDAAKLSPGDDVALSKLLAKRPKEPGHWTILARSASPAGLIKSLSRGPGSIALVSTEGGDILNKEFVEGIGDFNSFFSGEVKRRELGGHLGSVSMEHASVTLAVITQSATLDDFENKFEQRLRDSGFQSRVLYFECPSYPDQRHLASAEEDPAIRTFRERTLSLLREVSLDRQWRSVVFDPHTAYLFEQYHRYLEAARQPGKVGSEIAMFLGKAAEIASRIASLFERYDENTGLIKARHFLAAVDVMKAHLIDVRRRYGQPLAYRQMQGNAELIYSHLVNCSRSNKPWVHVSSLLQYGPNKIRKKEVRDAALDLLNQSGRISFMRFDGKTWVRAIDPGILV